MPYNPLLGVVPWEQHRRELEAQWRKANTPRQSEARRAPAIEPSTAETTSPVAIAKAE